MNMLNESIKNKLLGWIGLKSNQTEIEDLIDSYCSKPKGAERRNRPLLKKIMTKFFKDFNVKELRRTFLDMSVSDRNFEASYEEAQETIAIALRKMIGAERFNKEKVLYGIAVRLITNALLAMLAPQMKDNTRAAYQKYAAELEKQAEEKRKEEERLKKYYGKSNKKSGRTIYDPAGSIASGDDTGGRSMI